MYDKEPLGRKYRRLVKEFEEKRGSQRDEINRFLKNPNSELQRLRNHNEELNNMLGVMVDRNLKGIELEKKGDIENAIILYEENVVDEFEGAHPYQRLAVIYRKRKQYDDEIKVLKKAIQVFSDNSNSQPQKHCNPEYIHKLEEPIKTFEGRLKKAETLKNKIL